MNDQNFIYTYIFFFIINLYKHRYLWLLVILASTYKLDTFSKINNFNLELKFFNINWKLLNALKKCVFYDTKIKFSFKCSTIIYREKF